MLLSIPACSKYICANPAGADSQKNTSNPDAANARPPSALEIVNTYLKLETIRFAERLAAHMDAASERLDVKVPAMLVQSLVENAVKHGIPATGTSFAPTTMPRTPPRPGARSSTWVSSRHIENDSMQ